MDVSTRWDSTCTMMIRAVRLQEAINRFCTTFSYALPFSLSKLEWKQVGYLIDLVRPFNFFTTSVGKTRDITLPYALPIYDELFERLTESRRRLRGKVQRYPWVQKLIEGVDAAESKLDFYYNKTYSNLGSIYGIGALLCPSLKSTVFDKDYCWLDFSLKDWRIEYEEQLEELYQKRYSQQDTRANRLRDLRETNINPLVAALDRSRNNRILGARSQPLDQDEEDIPISEVAQWLETSKFYTNLYNSRSGPNNFIETDSRAPLLVWSLIEPEYPGLSKMAKDLLCIPLAGVGVERCFNFARDMCDYRRGQLAPETIRALLLVYFSQITKSRADKIQRILSSITNINDLSTEELEQEIENREKEIGLR